MPVAGRTAETVDKFNMATHRDDLSDSLSDSTDESSRDPAGSYSGTESGSSYDSDEDPLTDSDDESRDATPKSPVEGKTNIDIDVNTKPVTASIEAREREEEMSPTNLGANLSVDDNVKELFKYIARYKPKTIELDSQLKPFLPDYLPAIGDLDPFLKVGRPDQERDILGIEHLDEPASSQTDAQILIMQLRAQNKTSFRREDEVIGAIDHAEKNTTAIDKWISNVSLLHEQKPLPEVQYTQTMPSIDSLMEVWPEEFEQALIMDSNATVLPAELDMDLKDFATAACALVDIPVQENLVHSVHLLFTLWNTFRNNEHFKGRAEQMEYEFADQLEGTDFRPSTAAAIAAVSESMGARPSTAQAVEAAIAASMEDYRPDTSSGVNSITGNYRPDTASAIAAVMAAQERESNLARPDTGAALAAVAAMEEAEALAAVAAADKNGGK